MRAIASPGFAGARSNANALRSAIAVVLACVGCEAKLPNLTDANQPLDAKCSGPFADTLVDAFPPTLANPAAALRAPDGTTVSLAKDSVVTVGFIGLGGVTDVSGMDIRFHATLGAGGDAEIRLATSDMEFHFSGEIKGSMTVIDVAVAGITSAVYVRVIGVAGTIALDAVEATHDVCR